jgi:hypothetical protein
MGTKQLFDPPAQGHITRADLVQVTGTFFDGTRQAGFKNFLFRIGRAALGRFLTHPLYNAKLSAKYLQIISQRSH